MLCEEEKNVQCKGLYFNLCEKWNRWLKDILHLQQINYLLQEWYEHNLKPFPYNIMPEIWSSLHAKWQQNFFLFSKLYKNEIIHFKKIALVLTSAFLHFEIIITYYIT